MRTIFLDQAKPGDEIAEPVVNDRGMVILNKGARLSPSLIDRMRRMGVVELTVVGDDPNAPPPRTVDELLADLDTRFEGLEGNPLMTEIKKIARRHLLDRYPG